MNLSGRYSSLHAVIPVCPKCDDSLLILRLADVEVDFCNRCRGVWLDAGELEALAGSPDAPLLQRLRERPGTRPPQRQLCPRCDAALEEITVPDSPLTLDRCPAQHGLWFDADELQQVLTRLPEDPVAAKTVALLKDLFAYKKPVPQGGNP